MFEFARRVERIDVHRDKAGAQDAVDGDGVLQHVRHHDGDAVALLEAEALKPCRDLARLVFKLAVGQRLAHAGEGGAIGIARAGFLQQFRQ